MTFDEIKTFVRLHADADVTDAPDANLLVYARMAYNDILSRRVAWPHLSVRYTLTTVIGTSEYPLSGLSSTDMRRVTGISPVSYGSRLTYLTYSDAIWLFGSTGMTQGYTIGYTILGDSTIKLYPTPSTVQSLTVDGFRSAGNWPTTAGSIADLPRVFDEAICWFMLAKYYTSQEDPQLAAFYMNEYEMLVNRFVKSETLKRQQPRPAVMGGNNNARPMLGGIIL